MINWIKIYKVIDSKEKVLKLIQDMLQVALLFYETKQNEWFICEYINNKLNFLNNFIDLETPFNETIANDELQYANKSTLKFNIDFFDIFVTDYYKKSGDDDILIEHSPMKPFLDVLSKTDY